MKETAPGEQFGYNRKDVYHFMLKYLEERGKKVIDSEKRHWQHHDILTKSHVYHFMDPSATVVLNGVHESMIYRYFIFSVFSDSSETEVKILSELEKLAEEESKKQLENLIVR